jgi:hypothetical protein
MSIQAPQGILNIPNAILRVGKLSVDEVVGADTILNTVARNTILLVDDEAYHENKNWSLKLPNAWAGEFECNTASAGNYSEFNFYNEGASSNAQGYNLTFNDTAVELRYDGTLLKTGTLASTITGTGVKKVRLMFERTILSVTVDGTLVFTHDDTVGPRPRVYSTTAGGFLNFFTDGGALKNLKIVNEKWISDGTSNIAYVGGGEVAVGQALAFNRVSNVSQIKVDANVVTEYTGPHDRPLRKYPEVALTATSENALGEYGYKVDRSSVYGLNPSWRAFDNEVTGNSWLSGENTYTQSGSATGASAVDTFESIDGSWVNLQLPNKIRLNYIIIKNRTSSTLRNAKAGILWAKDKTESTWYRIHDFSGLNTAQSATNTIHVNETNVYDEYRLQITEIEPYSGAAPYGILSIGELAFYGHEEGSGSLDTTLKSVYNVPATTGTQLEVYYDGQDYTQASDFTGTGGVVDKAGGDQDGTAGTGVTFDSTYKAFNFDGTANGKIVGTHNFGTDTSPVLTMSFWMKRTAVSTGWSYVATIGTSTTGQMIGLTINPGNKFNFSNYGDQTVTSEPVLLNQWYHVTLIANGEAAFNSTNFKMYINGKEPVLSGHGGNSTTTLTGTQLTLGTNTNSAEAFNGSIANFRLYSKALNADQVKELYDYQKDYFLGSKSQVTLYKGHLGVGVTEPSSQLELAGDERIQEYPPGPMTDYKTYFYGHGFYEVRATSQYASTVIGAFDKTTSTQWLSSYFQYDTNGNYTGNKSLGGISGEYIIITMPYKTIIKSFQYFATVVSQRNVTLGKLLGSNDGGAWTILANMNNPTGGNITVDVNAVDSYTEYALVCEKDVGGNEGYAGMTELRLFGINPGRTTLDKGSLSLTRSLDVPRISRYDVDTETPRPEKLVVDFDTTVNSSPTDISGQGNHGVFNGTDMNYSSANKAFVFNGTDDYIDIPSVSGVGTGAWVHSKSFWFKLHSSTDPGILFLLGRNGSTRQIAVQVNGSGQFQYFIYGCNSRVQVNGSDWYPDVNRWYHCVTVFRNNETTADGSVLTGREMYIDGVKQTLVAIANQIALDLDSSEVRFGNQFNSIYLDYELSNPKLYNVALEPSEVKKLYNLGRTGRSMVISDTAVGIGKVPEAQLDVRGSMIVRGHADFNFAYRELHMYSKPDVYIYNSSGTALTLPYNAGGKYLFFRFPNYYSKNFEPIIASDYRYYVPENGLYFVRFTPFGGGTLNYEWFINKNRNSRNNNSDINYADGFGPYAYANGVAATTMSAIIPMTTTDYITFGAYVGSTNFDMSTRSSACITLIQRF